MWYISLICTVKPSLNPCNKSHLLCCMILLIYSWIQFVHTYVRLLHLCSSEIVVVQSLSHVWLFATPWTAAHQASLSFTISGSLLKFTSIESVMPSNHFILCCPLLLPSIFHSFRVFSSESVFCIRWPKYWSFSFNIISPSCEHPGLISFRMDWLDLLAVQGTFKSLLQTTVQKHQFLSAQLSSQSNSYIHTWPLEKP